MRIASVVHGRFFAFDLARALLGRGVSSTLFTNYPRFIARRFGIDDAHVRTNVTHGLAARAFHRLHSRFGFPDPEPMLHRAFSRWAARSVRREGPFDCTQCFSGVAEELFDSARDKTGLRVLVRGSAHIAEQTALLADEEARVGRRIEKPSSWIIEREEREYAMADVILVLSTFARDTFVARGTPASRLFTLPLGADLSRFRADRDVASERERRIRSGERLRILTTGTFSFQKGALDLAAVARALHRTMDFRFVGTVAPEAAKLAGQTADCLQFVPRQDEFALPAQYAWADVFLYPTVQDGYAAVLSQAQANGLPLLATTNCGAPDIVDPGASGWIVPIRRSELIQEQLVACDRDRGYLAGVAARSYERYVPRDWTDVAADFEAFVRQRLAG